MNFVSTLGTLREPESTSMIVIVVGVVVVPIDHETIDHATTPSPLRRKKRRVREEQSHCQHAGHSLLPLFRHVPLTLRRADERGGGGKGRVNIGTHFLHEMGGARGIQEVNESSTGQDEQPRTLQRGTCGEKRHKVCSVRWRRFDANATHVGWLDRVC